MAVRSHLALLTAALCGCEPQPARVASADTLAAVAMPDTVVRRVIRVLRQPSAIHRVTGVLEARRALEPLDSVLALRVYDQRGVEMSGVPVRWTLVNAGDGATVRMINSVTDSLGLSRVAFTPGRSASAQGVAAVVEKVGRIEFLVEVPVKAIRVLADSGELWAGEARTFTTELRDENGEVLSGGSVSWGTTDTSVMRVDQSDSLHAVVRGKLAGSADLVAWIGKLRGQSRLTVRPTTSGRFITIDGGPVPELRVAVTAGDVRETIDVSGGRFDARVSLPRDADVLLHAIPEDTGRYHPVHVRVMSARELQSLTIALIPARWRIDAGTYSGQEIAIDAARALRRSGGSAGFWRVAPVSGRAPRRILGWPESAFPLRIAFNRGRASDRIVADDSVAFWAIAEQMQRDLGARVFAPAEMPPDGRPTDLVPVEIASASSEGHTFVSWSEAGNAYDGVLTFRQAATLRNPHVVTHELLHLLGFGHTSAWPTVAGPTAGPVSRLTPQDVAHAQVAMRLLRLQAQTGARPGLPVLTP
jgi:hypothetical protein